MTGKGLRFVYLLALLAALFATTGCSLLLSDGGIDRQDVNSYFNSAAITQPYATNRVQKDQGGGFRTVHGLSCAEATKAASVDNAGHASYGVGVEETLAVPNGYVATVFLNGWRLKYHNSDHHVLAMANAIVDISQEPDGLHWTAGGVLSDGDGNDAFSWCYYYTALLWSPSAFDDATAFDSDSGAEMTFLLRHEEGFALAESQPNTLADFPDLPTAILPRGFGVIYSTGGDHHLKDFALKYGDPFFVSTSEDGSGSDVSWRFETSFGDKGFDDGYVAGELVTVVTGEAVETTKDDFAITEGVRTGGGSGERSVIRRTLTVDGLDYDNAVPVLQGWSLGKPGDAHADDSHIKEIGAWIESFDYARPTNSESGRLTYTIASIYRDRSSTGARTPVYQVDVVGFDNTSLVHTQVPTTTTMTQEEGSGSSPTSDSNPSIYDAYTTTSTTSTATSSYGTSTPSYGSVYGTSYKSYSTSFSF